jgi:hypothetical protein
MFLICFNEVYQLNIFSVINFNQKTNETPYEYPDKLMDF